MLSFMEDLDINLDFDLGFDLSEPEFDFDSRYISPPQKGEINEKFLKYEYAEDLARKIKLASGCRYFCIVNGSFYFGDFIEALIVENRLEVKKMTIATLSLNENNVDSLGNLLHDGFVDELNLIVSDYFFAHERSNLVPYIYKELDFDNKFQLAVCRNHTKICIFETHYDARIVIHGSANLRTSSNLEQFVLEDNRALYDFNDDWLSAIIEKYSTINKKSLRGKNLWQAVQDGKKPTANAAWQVQGKDRAQAVVEEEIQTAVQMLKDAPTEPPEFCFENVENNIENAES